jgi:hypothetical protein
MEKTSCQKMQVLWSKQASFENIGTMNGGGEKYL